MTLNDSYSITKTLFVLGSTSSAVASGGLLFTSYMHVPAYVLNTSDYSLLTQWRTMGTVGKSVVPPLALVAGGAHFINAYLAYSSPQRYRFVTAGLLSLAILPYTAAALAKLNTEIASRVENVRTGGMNGSERGLRELCQKWSARSAVRGFLMVASTVVAQDAMLRLTF